MSKYKLYILKGSNHDRSTLHGQIFMDMLALRIAGYYRYYGNQLMPIDLYDHFSTHFVLCKLIDDDYQPIACLRSISNVNCRENNVGFLPILRTKTSNPNLSKDVSDLVHNKHLNMAYDSGLTISPEITSVRENYAILKHMIGACLIHHLETDTMPFLISSIKKTKTDRLFNKIGFQPFSDHSEYRLKGLESEEFNLLIFHKDSLRHSIWIEKSLPLWQERAQINEPYFNKEPCTKRALHHAG